MFPDFCELFFLEINASRRAQLKINQGPRPRGLRHLDTHPRTLWKLSGVIQKRYTAGWNSTTHVVELQAGHA
jgi:hypothetical protein